MIGLWIYFTIGFLIGLTSLGSLKLGEKYGQGDRQARIVVDKYGPLMIIALITLLWPALAWMVWGKKR